MSLYVKPNIDKVLYLFSSTSKKVVRGGRCYEYRWDIPQITLNDWGKISMVSQVYKPLFAGITNIITRIQNVSTKDNVDTSFAGGTILSINCTDSTVRFVECPPVYLSPQSLNSITLTLTDDITNANGGVNDAECDFILVLKITENDLPVVEYGNKITNNNTQVQIPTYN